MYEEFIVLPTFLYKIMWKSLYLLQDFYFCISTFRSNVISIVQLEEFTNKETHFIKVVYFYNLVHSITIKDDVKRNQIILFINLRLPIVLFLNWFKIDRTFIGFYILSELLENNSRFHFHAVLNDEREKPKLWYKRCLLPTKYITQSFYFPSSKISFQCQKVWL